MNHNFSKGKYGFGRYDIHVQTPSERDRFQSVFLRQVPAGHHLVHKWSPDDRTLSFEIVPDSVPEENPPVVGETLEGEWKEEFQRLMLESPVAVRTAAFELGLRLNTRDPHHENVLKLIEARQAKSLEAVAAK